MAKFEFIRLSLSVPTIGDLAKGNQRPEPELSREEFLREAFSERREFFYSGRLYTYVPSPENTHGKTTISGYVGKPVTELVNAGPDDLFALTKSRHYRAAFLAVDVSPTEQVVAFERRNDVGSSQRITTALLDHYVKERKGFSWHTDVEYITSESNFWKAAREYRGRITELSFEFYPPNGLKGFDKFKEFDRLAKQQANGQSSEYALKNKDGAVVPEGDFVKSAVEYASEGPGKIKMMEGRKVLYNSRQSKRVKDAPEVIMPRQGEHSKILGLIGWLFGKNDG